MTVSKTQLIDAVKSKMSTPRSTIEAVLETVLQEIEFQASNGEKVIIRGFGTFSQAHRAERKVRNPATGAESIAPASSTLKFKAAKSK